MKTRLELKNDFFRTYRANHFRAFDLWEKAVIRGREQDSEEVMTWYQDMLDFPDQITENTTYENYPILPEVLKKYL
jgi:hypothetical protein